MSYPNMASTFDSHLQKASHMLDMSTMDQQDLNITDSPAAAALPPSLPKQSAASTFSNHGMTRSVGSCTWPPSPPPRQVTLSIDDHINTNTLSAFHGCKKTLSLPAGPSTSSLDLLQRCSMNETSRMYQKEGDVTDLPHALTLPSSSSKSNGKGKIFRFCRGYALGQAAKAPFHMVTKSSPQEAANELSLLKSHDFAFIKRTNEIWTYALLACRFVDESKEECMLFLLDSSGSTKIIKKKILGRVYTLCCC